MGSNECITQGIGFVSGGDAIGIQQNFTLPEKLNDIKDYDDAINKVFDNFIVKDKEKSGFDSHIFFIIVSFLFTCCWFWNFKMSAAPNLVKENPLSFIWWSEWPLLIPVLLSAYFGIFKYKKWRMLVFEVKCHKQLVSVLLKEKVLDEIIKSEKALEEKMKAEKERLKKDKI